MDRYSSAHRRVAIERMRGIRKHHALARYHYSMGNHIKARYHSGYGLHLQRKLEEYCSLYDIDITTLEE